MPNVRLDTKNVGDIIKIKENSTAVDFVIVHKGAPSTAYYGMGGGVIVLRKDIHSEGDFDSSNNDYANADVHSWCNGTYLNTIQEDIRNQIMTVRIPYRRGTSGSSVSTGANGLRCKVFLLSTKEVDDTHSMSANEGAVFSYFSGGEDSKRIAKLNGSPKKMVVKIAVLERRCHYFLCQREWFRCHQLHRRRQWYHGSLRAPSCLCPPWHSLR